MEEGGETAFPDLDIVVKPKMGKALLWPSVLSDDPGRLPRTIQINLTLLLTLFGLLHTTITYCGVCARLFVGAAAAVWVLPCTTQLHI